MSGTFEQKKGVGPICHLDKKWETIQNIVTYRKTTNSSHYAHHLHDHWPPCEHPSRKNMASTLFPFFDILDNIPLDHLRGPQVISDWSINWLKLVLV